MGLKRTGLKFRGKLKIEGGQTFLGQILDPPDTSRVSNFLTARRYLRTSIKTPVKANDVIIADSTSKFIVAEHADGFFKSPIYKHFKLFSVDEQIEWFTSTRVLHPVTGQPEDTFISQGLISVSIQPRSDLEDFTNIQVPQHELVLTGRVSLGDKLGEQWVVTKVDYQLGITVARVKES